MCLSCYVNRILKQDKHMNASLFLSYFILYTYLYSLTYTATALVFRLTTGSSKDYHSDEFKFQRRYRRGLSNTEKDEINRKNRENMELCVAGFCLPGNN